MVYKYNALNYAEKLGFGEVHLKIDHEAGLQAIIAVHNTQRGPAIGGCRWLPYNKINDAVHDALRLARGMTFKAAVCDLPHGGAKAVLIKPADISLLNKDKYFAAFAKFVNELNGQYITAADSGTSSLEMDIVAKYTSHVSSTSKLGNPAIYTARGVHRGIQAAVKFKLNKSSLKGLHIAIQGLGQVGHLVAQACYQEGARLTLADMNTALASEYACQFDANVCSPAIIHTIAADVFSPCALGGVFDHQTISELRSSIIAGAANNQLAEAYDGRLLHRLGILYAPDYVINAGGLIHASGKYQQRSEREIENKVDHIHDTLMTVFERSCDRRQSTSNIADSLALEMLTKKPTSWQ